MDVYGVDYSGAQQGQVWLVSGRDVDGALSIRTVERVRGSVHERNLALLQRIQDSAREGALWALDFPFSLPLAFGQRIAGSFTSWRVLALALESALDFEAFSLLGDAFIRDQGGREPMRVADRERPGAYSCLHNVNPRMRQMTFYGMRLLAAASGPRVAIPPIYSPRDASLTILETHPHSTLRSLFNGDRHWRGYKKGRHREGLRQDILARLEANPWLPVGGLPPEVRETVLRQDDALDSLIACWTGALWYERRDLFDDPPGDPVIELEGWIWTPSAERLASAAASG